MVFLNTEGARGPSAAMVVFPCACVHVDKTVDEVQGEEDVNSCDIKETVASSEGSISVHEIETLQLLDLIMDGRKNNSATRTVAPE